MFCFAGAIGNFQTRHSMHARLPLRVFIALTIVAIGVPALPIQTVHCEFNRKDESSSADEEAP